MTDTSSRPGSRLPLVALALLGLLAALWIGASSALAASTAEITIVRTNAKPQQSGAPTQYTISFSCSSVEGGEGQTCGEDPTIRIPLGELTSAFPGTPAMDTWSYSVSSGISGLIEGGQGVVENGAYVIRLDSSKLVPGDSDTIQLNVTPPGGITPNGTAWTLKPSFETEDIPATAVPEPADGEAEAKITPAVSKKTLDEGVVYVRGHEVTFNITASCTPGGTTGKLFMTEGALVDQLPAGLEYVSADPEPDVHPAPGGSGEIKWSYPNAGSLPAGCGQGSTGKATYRVTAMVPAAGIDGEEVTNTATFTGKPIDEAPKSTAAPLGLRLVNEPPAPVELGDGFLGKGAQAPICIAEDAVDGEPQCSRYAGTYPGHWITPANPTPGLSPGSAEGRFDVTIAYPASRAYETDLVDPMPCLDEETAPGEYSSRPIAGEVKPGSIPVCANPAFHPTAIRVSAPSLVAALDAGWLPKAILTDGTTIDIALHGSAASTAYFDIPSENLGEVAAIELPPDVNLTDNHMQMNVFGYADAALESGDILHDVAFAGAYPIGEGTAAGTSHDDAKIYIEPADIQLGLRKSFGGLSNGPGGTSQLTTMSLVASLAVPADRTLTGDVVLTDLLPERMNWVASSRVASAPFIVTYGLNGTAKEVTATITRDDNFEGTTRELIRVTLPQAAFEENEGQGGFFTIKPKQSDLFRMEVPNETSTFNNSAQIFVLGIGRQTQPVCGSGEGTAPAEFQSKDEYDLSGSGEEEQNFCQSTVPLTVHATGGANFSLRKFVQGELDQQRKGAGGVGTTTRAGTGVFSLVWANNGSTALKNPVIYDILPYVGDAGVDESQSGNARESEFATEFVKVIEPLPNGVEVEYSTSTNPCRPEVNVAAQATCDNDWVDTPSDPGQVKALRFSSSQTYPAGAPPLALEIEIKLPYGDVNDIAWNSAATNAVTTDNVSLLPAEPPKVGITAPAPLIEPTVSTAVSEASILPEGEVHDQVTVTGTDDLNGAVDWKLLGPVAPQDGDCEGLDWSGAATVDQGSFAFTADGSYPTAATELTSHGCYTYEVEVTGTGFVTATSPAGTAGELVLVHPAGPGVATTVSAASVLPETEVTDSVKVTGTEGFGGTVSWKLFGPVAPQGGACDGVDWSGAAIADEGDFAIDGDSTTSTAATELTEHGCYGYEVTLEGEHLTTATSPVGSAGEVLVVHPAVPTVSTAVSAASVLPGTEVTDTVTIAGTAGFDGVAHWSLAGPVSPAADDSCEGVDWSGAKVVADGEFAVDGDGTATTAATKLTDHGCYGYAVTVEGAHLATATSPLGSHGETVLVHPAKPSLATSASPRSGDSGLQASDLITVGDTSGFAGSVHWKLVGPVSPGAGESCDGRNWGGAPVVAQGDFEIAGDTAQQTPGTALTAAGCYGYEARVEGPHLVTVTSPLGSAGEMVLVRAAPPAGTADLTIVKRVAEGKVELGKPLHYTIEVTNKGTAPATDTVVTDTPRSPLGFVAASSSRGGCGHAFPLTCRLGTLAPGAKATIKVTAKPLAGGKVVNDATVTSPDDPASKGGKGVKAAAAARSLIPLRLSKTVSPGKVDGGGTLRYAIVVSNPTAATAHSVSVCDRLPAGLVYVSSNPAAKLRGGSHCWRLATLKGRAKKTIRVVVRALAGAGGRLVNVATLEGPDAVRRKAGAAAQVNAQPVREGGVTG